MIKTRKLEKGEWVFLILSFILLSISLKIYSYDELLSNASILFSGIVAIILFISMKLNIIKSKDIIKSKEKEKREEKKLKKQELEELKERINNYSIEELKEFREKSDEERKILYDRIKKIEEESISEIIWKFCSFGVIILFLGIMFIGSFQNDAITKEFSARLNNSLELGNLALKNSMNIVTNSFYNLFMNLYYSGAVDSFFGIKIKLFYWLFFIAIFYWIGWLYIWKILMKGSWWTIKEIIIPMYKNLIKEFKQGQSELGNGTKE